MGQYDHKNMNEMNMQKQEKKSVFSSILWAIAIVAILVLVGLYVYGRSIYQTI